MAKLPTHGKCVHCLKIFEKLTWDHVLPTSWYPNTSPQNVERPKVPSCEMCNNNLGVIEERLLRNFALCLDPNHPASMGILPNVLKSMRSDESKSKRENDIRMNLRGKVVKEAKHGTNIPTEGIIPGLHQRWNQKIDEQVAFLVAKDDLVSLTEKIVRGIIYLADRKFVEPPYKINFYILHPSETFEIVQALNASKLSISFGPGLRVRRAVAADNGMIAIFELNFWEQFQVYASVTDD